MDRVRNQQELFSLPESQIPHSVIAFGNPEKLLPDIKAYYVALLAE